MLSAVALYQKENPIFGASRLGVYTREVATKFSVTLAKTSYEITDHLGNVRAVIEENPNLFSILLSYADYYAFGEQLPSRNTTSDYRYAFQGQELDKETGMEAFQLRFWDGRIGRWLSPDPYGQYASPYLGMGNNPVNMIDPDGGFVEPTKPGITHSAQPEGDYFWNSVTNTYEFEQRIFNSTPFDDANNLLTIAMNTSGKFTPLDKYVKALRAGKFFFSYNGVDKFWKMGYNGGGNGKVESSLIKAAKIETQVLGSLGRGLKWGGYGLSALGGLSTEWQYQQKIINNDRRVYDQSLNGINFLVPELALGTIPGNYLGQKYHKEIMNQVTNPNAVLNSTVGNILNFFGVPTSKK